MLKSPVEFVKDIKQGRHFVLFYENAEYSRSICFEFLKSGMENQEHSFYITAKEDKDFFKNEFIEKMYGPNVIYQYNDTSNARFKEDLFHGQNISDLASRQVNRVGNINSEIVDIVKDIIQEKQGDLVNKNNNSSDNNSSGSSSRLILRCIHKIETQNQIQDNITWERNYRNIKLRQDLPNTSLICTYPVDKIIEVLEGKSKAYSPWMTDLLEIYDGVIYARNNWTGAAFNFV